MALNVLDIVEKHLIDNQFDGLFNVDVECACLIKELSPGDCIFSSCQPGYKKTHSVTGQWIVHGRKGEVTDKEIQDIIDGVE
jgi:hypothetical protein